MTGRLKRVVVCVIGVVVALLGLSSAASALLGYYGSRVGLIAAITVAGLALVALGAFLVRIALRGSDAAVSDVDLV